MLRRRLPNTAKDFCRIPTSTLPCTFRILTTPRQGLKLFFLDAKSYFLALFF